MHPPHSTVLRREEGKGIHIQLTDRKIIYSLNIQSSSKIKFVKSFHTQSTFITFLFNEVTTWPRLDNDAPSVLERCGSNSPTEVVGTMSEGCDLLEQSTGFLVGYPRAPFASVVTTFALGLPCGTLHPRDSSPLTLVDPTWVRGARAPDCSGTGRSGSPPGRGSGDPLRDPPKKGGPGPPQKGGCRDTKQCKFWRVSSVLIQGLFCFLGVRGGLRGGPPGGRFWGVSGVGPSAREPGDTPPVVRPGRNPPSTRGPRPRGPWAVPGSCELPPVALHVLGDTARESSVLTAVGE